MYHSEKVKDGKITDYQIIIPSTWNLAPHDPDGNYGPMEQALIGVPVADIEKPINALRTVHSFDPCTACAVHIVEPKTGKSFETIEQEFAGHGYGDFKQAVGESVVELLRPIREETERLLADKSYLESVYRAGAEKAAYVANRTLNKVYKKVGFLPR